MAIIETDPEPVSLTVTYSILSFIFLGTACFTFQTTNFSRHAPDCAHSYMLRFGFCAPSLIYCIILATLAVSTRFVLDLYSPWTYILYIIQSIAVPILMNVLFEICYLVHKSRSVNFAGLEFDQGHRVRILNSRTRSFILRNSIRIVSLILLVIGLVANFNIVINFQAGADALLEGGDVDEDTENVGRIGWWGLYPWHGQVHLLLSLLPAMVLVVVAFYLSIVLWRYGTNSSIVVHSSYINPWCSQFFGTLCMAIGQCFGENLYLITSHLGFLLLIWSDLYLMRKEISKEILQTKDFEDFLQKVADLGNDITIRNMLMPGSIAADPPVIPSTTIVSDNDDDDDVDDNESNLNITNSSYDDNDEINNNNDDHGGQTTNTSGNNNTRHINNKNSSGGDLESQTEDDDEDLNVTIHARGGGGSKMQGLLSKAGMRDATIEYNNSNEETGDLVVVPGEQDDNNIKMGKNEENMIQSTFQEGEGISNPINNKDSHKNTQSIDGFDVKVSL